MWCCVLYKAIISGEWEDGNSLEWREVGGKVILREREEAGYLKVPDSLLKIELFIVAIALKIEN